MLAIEETDGRVSVRDRLVRVISVCWDVAGLDGYFSVAG
jgi:hypothetical protein